MRRTIAAAFLLAFASAPVLAGDIAELDILGFDAEASVFAFEEYGLQDGSGFPFARRFYIDVAADRFLPGTPVRILVEDEKATLAEARSRARAAGEAILADAELAANRGFTVAFNPVTELSADPFRVAVNPRPVLPAFDPPLEFRLEEVAVPQPSGCENLGPVVGYRLLRIDAQDGGRATLLHEDRTVPQSRRCPTGYRLGAVQTVYPAAGEPSFAVLIQVESFGFEGPNQNWIAVTGRL